MPKGILDYYLITTPYEQWAGIRMPTINGLIYYCYPLPLFLTLQNECILRCLGNPPETKPQLVFTEELELPSWL